jgi:cytochrome b pre-mRNA-processing protein 3
MTMTWLARLLGKREDESAALKPLWQRIVAIAREPEWYVKGGVADSMEGRFDMVALITALVMLRMEREPALLTATARLSECFIADMEGQLRQEGIGDPTLGKRLGELMGALGGRIGALRDALALDEAAFADAIARNVTFAGVGDAAAVAGRARDLVAALDRTTDSALLAGEVAR